MALSWTRDASLLMRSLQGWLLVLLLVICGSGVPAQAYALTGTGLSSTQPIEEDEDCAERALDEAKLAVPAGSKPGRDGTPRIVLRKAPDPLHRRTSPLHSASTSGGESSRRNGYGSTLRC